MSNKTWKGSVEAAVGKINEMLRDAVSDMLQLNNVPVPEMEYSVSYPPVGATSGVKFLKGATSLASQKPVMVDRTLSSGRPRVIINPAGIVETEALFNEDKTPVLDDKGRQVVVRLSDIDPKALFAFALHGAVCVLHEPDVRINAKGSKVTRQYTEAWGNTAAKVGLNKKTKFHLDGQTAHQRADKLIGAIKGEGLYPYLVAATIEPKADAQKAVKFFLSLDPKGAEPIVNAKSKKVTFTVTEGRADFLETLAGKPVYWHRLLDKAETLVETTEADPAEETETDSPVPSLSEA